MTPTVGRIVHYRSHGTPDGTYKPEPRAAIITAVKSDHCVDLCVLNPEGMYFNRNVYLDPELKGGSWSWPPKV